MGKLYKENIISCLVGIVLGTAGTFGGQTLFYNNSTQQSPYSSKQEITNFDIVDYDANGYVYITRYEKNITMNDVPLSNLRNLSELILQMREKQV